MDGLDALEKRKQWIIWTRTPKQNGKVDKIPIDPLSEGGINAHSPSNWMDFDTASMFAKRRPASLGVGFVFTRDDPYSFIDVDNCVLPDGHWAEHARWLCEAFAGAAIGVSQSGRGLHIICTGQVPEYRSIQHKDPDIDLYTDGRFMAVSPHGYHGDCERDCTPGISELVRVWLPPRDGSEGGENWTTEPVPEYTGPVDNTELIALMMRERKGLAALGGRATFEQLWTGSEELGRWYPDDHQGRPYNASQVDIALAEKLAFYTGKNCERIRELMQESRLRRDKWTSRPGYVEDTIKRAVGWCTKVYDRVVGVDTVPDGPPSEADADGYRPGYQFLPVSEQVEYFRGCTYISGINRVMAPNGQFLRQNSFRATYGGYKFALDLDNDYTTRNAWEAFTESHGYQFPTVNTVGFHPLRPSGERYTTDGLTTVNSFVPRYGERRAGDAGPFLSHVDKLLPNQRDADILLDYMAACIQYSGYKFQWAVLLQGAQGNGKSVLAKILAYALGAQYVHIASPSDVRETKFNSWICNKLLIIIEEMNVSGIRETAENLKPLITNDRVAVQAKGQDQMTGDNFANFLMFSNYKDAVMKSQNDRRYCVLLSAQQSPKDIDDMGMTPQYFHGLFAWLNSGGCAIAADYLARRRVGVDVMSRAPYTTSTTEAIEHSLGAEEQIIQEAVESGLPGFQVPFIRYDLAEQLLRNYHKFKSPKITSRIIQNLGYEHHRFVPRIQINGLRQRVYVLAGSPESKFNDTKKLVPLITAHFDPKITIINDN